MRGLLLSLSDFSDRHAVRQRGRMHIPAWRITKPSPISLCGIEQVLYDMEMKQMHLGRVTALAVTLLLVACANQHEEPKTASKSAPAAQVSSNCPSQDFDAFLAAFMQSVEIQQEFTVTPLQSDAIDAQADPEPRSITRMLSEPELTYPLVPNPEQQANGGLVMSTAKSGNEMAVKLVKPDSDYQVLYYFRHEACWMLYRKNDESL